jgi:hypothetical protein
MAGPMEHWPDRDCDIGSSEHLLFCDPPQGAQSVGDERGQLSG